MNNPSSPASDDRLSLLYRLSQTFNSTLDLDEVLDRVMDEVIAVTQAERGFVMLMDEGGDLVFHTARGMDQDTIEEPGFQISRGIVNQVAREGQPMLTSDAQSDSQLSLRASVIHLGLRSVLCVPLQVKGNTIGVIYVDNRLQAGIFTQDDLELLNAIASSAAIAIENARLYQVAVEKGRMERELQMAYKIQAGLLPRSMPEVPGWDFAARWKPAREVAGDFYDFIPLEEGRLGLVIADVTDKGMPAALFMAFTRSIIRASLDRAVQPVEAIRQANRLICRESSYGFFVTLFYAQFEPDSAEVTYVSAGHNPQLRYLDTSARSLERASAPVFQLGYTGMPLGIEEETPYEQRHITCAPGDCLLLYTDGVTDAVNDEEEHYSLARLQSFGRDNHRASPQEIITNLDSELLNFVGDTPQFDDITVVIAKRR
ncbi:MAG: SpoIIE family protein phosphatase [Anaerolineales bacterium]|jgi:sigma-B regulation protein RsbU (phosphoserine phosphatase)